ncbi:hypothetical protein [Arcobacter porcinus]|uniref:hypothetical protein n=1 Tax=Arcobacter porcinus TaxID=1935204 RepID=UPI000826C55C|nr:hypothetical protein [Arcobacter porcinus]OCL86164.1 hypothetical protein AAX30_01505 [Arcobacter porcinus]
MKNYTHTNNDNQTKIVCNKEIVENLRTQIDIRDFLISSINEIYEDDSIYKKQKVVAIKHLVKDLRYLLTEESHKYKLNLVIRNLNEFHTLQKSNARESTSDLIMGEAKKVIQGLVFLAYSYHFSIMCKKLTQGKGA